MSTVPNPPTISRAILQAIMDTIMDGVLVVDSRGEVLAVNQRFFALWRIPAELQGLGAGLDSQLLASVLDQLMEPDAFMEGISRLYRSEEESTDLLRFKDGRVYERASRSLVGEVRGRLWIFRDVTQQKRLEADLLEQAARDPLTGLGNRMVLQESLAAAIFNYRRRTAGFAVCYFDIDGFKQINDAYGHDAGDQLLVEMGKRFRKALRAGDTLTRMGGDEFVVLLAEAASSETVEIVVGRLLDAGSHPCCISPSQEVTVSISIGVALYPDHGESAQALIRAADDAMYVAKQAGKNRFAYADCTGLKTADT